MGILLRSAKLILFRAKWRKNNKHNMTMPKRLFNSDYVKVGKYTYGPLEIFSYGSDDEFLKIGDFVSIASGVKFILGGNHNMNFFSTYPFKVKLFGGENESFTKGNIVISDDVWIGLNSIILSGIKIGQGAVIGAGSVVTKDIPPYAIAVGNPAQIIKYRFEKNLIAKMMLFDYTHFDKKKVADKIELLYKELDVQVYDQIIGK